MMVVWLSLCLAFVAAVSAGWAAVRGPRNTLVLNMARGALATVYFAGYIWLLATDVDRGEWSEVMTGVGLVSWPVVWIYPPWFTYRHRHHVRTDVQ